MKIQITEASTLADLDRALQALDLHECRVQVHLGGRLTAYVGNSLRSVGAYGQGSTPAEAIDNALAEWQANTIDPTKYGLLSKLLVVIALALSFGACATEDEPEPPPLCSDIGAPDSLLCTAGGVCWYEGVECCQKPAPGRPVDEKCAVYQ